MELVNKMIVFIDIALIYLFLISVFNLFRILYSLRLLKVLQLNDLTLVNLDSAPRFFILIPLLYEGSIVNTLIKKMNNLKYDNSKISIIFITSEREKSSAAGRTTYEILKESLNGYDKDKFRIIHCDSLKDRCKADQLNFALEELNLLNNFDKKIFIGVYDADSTPHPDTLKYIAKRLEKDNSIRAFQQLPIYFNNINNIKRSLLNYIVLARPFHNLHFALQTELFNMHLQKFVLNRKKPSLIRILFPWLSHAIGHGEFFRLDMLNELGRFKPPSCDTQFGHTLAYAGIPIVPIPLFDYGETPKSIKILLSQGVVWFNSLNTYFMTWKFVRNLRPEGYSRFASFFMSVKLFNSNLSWAVYPLILVFLLFYLFIMKESLLILFFFLSFFIYLIPLIILLLKYESFYIDEIINKEDIRLPLYEKICIFIVFPFEKIFSCISPLFFCFKKLLSIFFKKELLLKKTER